MSKVTFNNQSSPFFRTLKSKVDAYFAAGQLHPAGNGRLYTKSLIQVATACALYGWLVFITPAWPLALLLCALLGINLAAIGFNVMHEGGHQSFSSRNWLNQLAAYSLNALGGSTYYWKIKHNINHHTYTNIEGLDSDIDVRPFMRLHEHQALRWFHRYQHFYWVILYAISYPVWVFYHDFEKYFTGRVAAGSSKRALPGREQVIFWSTKLGYVGIYLVVPILLVGLVQALVGYLIVSFTCGLFISIVFQLAHVVEGTHFPDPASENTKINQEWALHQVQTTANFATDNRIISWLLGGLNFQVEHHLFPRVSHVHYPQLNRLVKQTCREFNVAYLEYPSVGRAFQSHLMHLRKMGRPQLAG